VRLTLWLQKGARVCEFWLVLSEVFGAELRERQMRTLVIKGELARVKAKLRKFGLGEFLLRVLIYDMV